MSNGWAHCGVRRRRVAIMAAMPAAAEKPEPEPAVVPIPRRGRIWVILASACAGRPRLRGCQHRHPEGGPRRRPPRRHLRSPGNLRRRAAGRRPPRLLRRSRHDPGLQRPAVLELPGRLPQHDSRLGQRLRPARRREAPLPPLLGQRKPAGARLLRRRGGGRSRAMAGSTPTSSSATRTKRNGSASTRTSSTRSPAGSRN